MESQPENLSIRPTDPSPVVIQQPHTVPILNLPSSSHTNQTGLLKAPEDLTYPGCYELKMEALTEVIINMSASLAAERLHREKVQHENFQLAAQLEHLRMSRPRLEENASKLDFVIANIGVATRMIEQHHGLATSLAALTDENTDLRDRLEYAHRLNFTVEQKLDNMPLCYSCHENKKRMHESSEDGLPYDDHDTCRQA